MSDGARKADRRFTYLANPEVEAKRQRPMKTNADLKTNAGFTDFFSLAGRWIFFLRRVSHRGPGWPRTRGNPPASAPLGLGSLSAQDPLSPSPAAHNLRLCAQAPGFAGDPRRAARGERWAAAAVPTRPRAPLLSGRPGPRARTHPPGPNVRRPPGRGARPHSLTMAARPRCAVQGSRLPLRHAARRPR